MVTVMLPALLGPFVLSVAATVMVRGWARRRGYLDRPGGHKQHRHSVALGGGIAVTTVIVVTLLGGVGVASLVRRWGGADWLPTALVPHLDGVADKTPLLVIILAGALALHVLGIIDDSRPLAAGIKLVVQIIVSFTLAGVAGIRVFEFLPAPISVAATVLWFVLIMNAFNFLDNMDGLCAGVAIVAGVVFALSAVRTGQIFVPAMTLVVVGALLGFLPFNFAPATVYLGDAGSLVVGYFLAVLTALTTFYNPDQQLQPFGVLVPVVVLAVPLYDVGSVCVRRVRRGQSIFEGDRGHFSHRLVARGLSVPAAVTTIYLATAATSLSAVLLPSADWLLAAMIFAQCICVVAIIAILEGTRGAGEASRQ